MKIRNLLFSLLGLCCALGFFFYRFHTPAVPSYTLTTLPPYSGEATVILDDNHPSFPDEDKNTTPFERYSQLDYLGRCGDAYANVCLETMPTEERGSIGQVKPSGWHTVKYDFVDGKYLYNRCHLIGYQLTGENANELNLITGTRYLNMAGMLPYENQIADYVQETGNHVLYRVTPIYNDLDLVASGVEMEAWSVEDKGAGVEFHVYAYNVQPGVEIDYTTGESWASDTPSESTATPAETTYILNTSSKKFHLPTCSGASSIKPSNRQECTSTREELLTRGYSPCGICHP